MGFFNFRGLCSAFLFVPSLAFAQTVSTEVAAGTTHYTVTKETISTPKGSSITAVRDINSPPSLKRLPNGSISQSSQGRLFIASKTAGRIEAPVKGAFVVGKETLKSGAKKLLKVSPWLFAGELGLMGLDKLLRESGWEPYEDASGNQGFRVPDYDDETNYDGGRPELEITPEQSHNFTSSGAGVSHGLPSRPNPDPSYSVVVESWKECPEYWCRTFYFRCKPNVVAFESGLLRHPSGQIYGAGVPICYYQYSDPENPPQMSSPYRDITDSDIDDAVDNNYDPAVEDWDRLFPYIFPDSFTLDDIPPYSTPKDTITITDHQTGDITTVEKWTDISFDVSGSGSSQPSITVTEQVKEDTYINGELKDSNTTESQQKPDPEYGDTTKPDTGSGSGGEDPPKTEWPAFCSWASVVCDWIGWTKQLPEGDEPDLSGLIQEYDFTESKEIAFGDGQCPAPMELEVSFLKAPIKIDYSPFCDLAGIIYYFVMVSGYLIAIRITLGVANG